MWLVSVVLIREIPLENPHPGFNGYAGRDFAGIPIPLGGVFIMQDNPSRTLRGLAHLLGLGRLHFWGPRRVLRNK